MDIGFVGLRRDAVARRLAQAGIRVLGVDADGRAEALAAESVLVAMPDTVALARALAAPRVVWLDLATGFATELAIQDAWPELAPGDVIVDAGGGDASDGHRRAASLASARIHFIDCFVHGDESRLALSVGGDPVAVRVLAPYADIVAGATQWTHCGPPGAGYHAGLRNRVREDGP